MFVVPAPAPVTIPMPDPVIVATPLLLLSHVPPAVASVRFVVDPTQAFVLPVMFAGIGLTVTMAVL